MFEIRDYQGNVIQRSSNLRGIRRYVGGRHAPIIDCLAIDRIGVDEGKLMILFRDKSSFECNFASFDVLKQAVRQWRNVQGSPLRVNGLASACVSRDNPRLQ